MPYPSITSYQPTTPSTPNLPQTPVQISPSNHPSLLKIPQNLAETLRESTLLDVRSLQDQPRTISFKTAAILGVAAFFFGVIVTLIITFMTY